MKLTHLFSVLLLVTVLAISTAQPPGVVEPVTDGRSGYNRRDTAKTDGRSGYNRCTTEEEDGRSVGVHFTFKRNRIQPPQCRLASASQSQCEAGAQFQACRSQSHLVGHLADSRPAIPPDDGGPSLLTSDLESQYSPKSDLSFDELNHSVLAGGSECLVESSSLRLSLVGNCRSSCHIYDVKAAVTRRLRTSCSCLGRATSSPSTWRASFNAVLLIQELSVALASQFLSFKDASDVNMLSVSGSRAAPYPSRIPEHELLSTGVCGRCELPPSEREPYLTVRAGVGDAASLNLNLPRRCLCDDNIAGLGGHQRSVRSPVHSARCHMSPSQGCNTPPPRVWSGTQEYVNSLRTLRQYLDTPGPSPPLLLKSSYVVSLGWCQRGAGAGAVDVDCVRSCVVSSEHPVNSPSMTGTNRTAERRGATMTRRNASETRREMCMTRCVARGDATNARPFIDPCAFTVNASTHGQLVVIGLRKYLQWTQGWSSQMTSNSRSYRIFYGTKIRG
ncbi:hypothetical protein C8T65DRAFT_703937 [Cerioporus squamosus]|nr:hypothetical protein C8T65DRAFT_703937 [Cerioporus squamosus]